ncbi:halocarboxylic acid dehydrogenase DehI family protein [Halobium salinum]|uniref:Halocarboxylic acid dehydrogenase DehI family protein n=1 Tax=Halobium salinum TaxID=1364940 RepID=A0ABD5PCC5_9EURY|nr:halocarboxylic acid dehydrogenase DehI family protein [Halobium salinum]
MDTDRQLYEADATGWKRGLYEDVQTTFRAPVVNWIFRTLLANEPDLTRYLWGQVKPAFETRAFGSFTLQWRDAVLSAVEGGDADLPVYRKPDHDLSPAEFAELRGQLATFDVVVPRLAVLFETVDRSLRGDSVGESPAEDRAATAPLPDWLDRDRAHAPRSPTMTPFSDLDEGLSGTVEAVQSFHGFDEGLPSVYRCLAQWPGAFERLWDDVAPVLESEAFERAVTEATDLAADYVSSLPYRPRLAPEDLRSVGVDDGTVEELRGLFETFNRGPVRTVLPAVPAFAAAFGVEGERSGL